MKWHTLKLTLLIIVGELVILAIGLYLVAN